MRDKTFQWSLTGLTALVIAWIIVGIVFDVLAGAVVIFIGIIVELGLGGSLLHLWGKGYTERTEDSGLSTVQPQDKTAKPAKAKSPVAEQTMKEKLIPGWQITTTTINCERVGHEVTLAVNKEWIVTCVYYNRWGPIRRKKQKGINKAMAWLGIGSDEKHLPSRCPGADQCAFIIEFQDKLYEKEIAANN